MENFRKAKNITNYMTLGSHRRCARIVNIIAGRHWSYKTMANSFSYLKGRISYLENELEKSETAIETLDRENTKLLSENESMQKCIKGLELDNRNMKQDIVQKDEYLTKQATEFQELKQLFIDKTIELDRLKKDSWYKRLFKIGW
jgi:predicted RNase H-like nuclease (RuvC/YqgF family)